MLSWERLPNREHQGKFEEKMKHERVYSKNTRNRSWDVG